MSEAVDPQCEYIELPLDPAHPLAAHINVHPHRTANHFDIHVGLELGVVLAGASRRLYDQHSYVAERGQVWFSGLWEPHGFQVLRPPARHLVIFFLPEFLDLPEPFTSFDWLKIFKLPPKQRPSADSPEDRKFALAQARKLIQLAESDNERNWLIRARLILQEIIIYFSERIENRCNGRSQSEPSFPRQQFLPALMLVEQRRGQNVTIAEAARAAHMSRSLFLQKFRTAVGIPFGQYCQRRRLAGAIYDLRSTDLKLVAVALNWGYCDAAHFARHFKSVIHMTPSQYREYWRSHRPSREPVPRIPVQLFDRRTDPRRS